METPDDLIDTGLTEADWQAIAESQSVTPPNKSEWAIYFRKREEERAQQREARSH